MAKILTRKQTRHGFHGTPVYKAWCHMVKRCENESSKNWKYYGGRGIKVCNEWRENPKIFCEWALSNGFEPGLELDRIDNNGDYSPENCRFVSHKENCKPGRRRLFSNNKTGHTGIYESRHGTFEIHVQVGGTQKYIGSRKTISEAIQFRDGYLKAIHDHPDY